MANFDAARVVLGERKRGYLLAFQGFLFARNRTRNEKIYWRCIDSTCCAFLHTNAVPVCVDANIRVLSKPPNHAHPPSDSSITRRDLVRDMVSRVQADPCAPVRNAYDIVTANAPAVSADAVPSFAFVENLLRRRRGECFPAIPGTLGDVNIQGEWSMTWRDRRHLSHLDNDWGLAVFMTNGNARLLSQCETVFLDGTFRTAPHPYKQLVTVHGLLRGTVFPFCFSLLSGKTVGLYRQLLIHVKQRVRQLCHRNWRPANAVCDFEMALVTAIETELPNTRVRGCYFHFTQSLWRRISILGLVTQYRDRNSTRGRRLRKIVQKLMSLGFLPPMIIARVFQVHVVNDVHVVTIRPTCCKQCSFQLLATLSFLVLCLVTFVVCIFEKINETSIKYSYRYIFVEYDNFCKFVCWDLDEFKRLIEFSKVVRQHS